MHHFEGTGQTAHLAARAGARRAETLLLASVEMEETQLQRTRAVAEPHEQRATPGGARAGIHLGQLHLATDRRLVTGTQRADRGPPAAILIACRQMQEPILNGVEIEAREFAGHTAGYALEDAQR